MEPRAQAYRVVTPRGSVAEVERYVAKLATWKVARGCPKENRGALRLLSPLWGRWMPN